jgi:hypothetical protein
MTSARIGTCLKPFSFLVPERTIVGALRICRNWRGQIYTGLEEGGFQFAQEFALRSTRLVGHTTQAQMPRGLDPTWQARRRRIAGQFRTRSDSRRSPNVESIAMCRQLIQLRRPDWRHRGVFRTGTFRSQL